MTTQVLKLKNWNRRIANYNIVWMTTQVFLYSSLCSFHWPINIQHYCYWDQALVVSSFPHLLFLFLVFVNKSIHLSVCVLSSLSVGALFVTIVIWAWRTCLICMLKARRLKVYISGKSWAPMLQAICITSSTLKIAETYNSH